MLHCGSLSQPNITGKLNALPFQHQSLLLNVMVHYLVAQKCCCICEKACRKQLFNTLDNLTGLVLICSFVLAADHNFRTEQLYSSQSILQWIYFISSKAVYLNVVFDFKLSLCQAWFTSSS